MSIASLTTKITAQNIEETFLRFCEAVRYTSFQARRWDDAGDTSTIYTWPRMPKYGRWNPGPILQGHIRTNLSFRENIVSDGFFAGPTASELSGLGQDAINLIVSRGPLLGVAADLVNASYTKGVGITNALTKTNLPNRTVVSKLVYAPKLYEVFNEYVRKQMVIGYVSYAYKIFGTGGNVGTKSPSDYNSSRSYTLFVSERAVTWLTSSFFSPFARGNAFSNPDSSTYTADWVISVVYGTSDDRTDPQGVIYDGFIPRYGPPPYTEGVYVGNQGVWDPVTQSVVTSPVFRTDPAWRFWPDDYQGPNDKRGSPLTLAYTSLGNPDAANIKYRVTYEKPYDDVFTVTSTFRGYTPYVSSTYRVTTLGKPKTTGLANTRKQVAFTQFDNPAYVGFDNLDATKFLSSGTLLSNGYAGNLITKTSIETMYNFLMNKLKFSYEYNLVIYEQSVCHASCHTACHGSRGRR